MPPNAAHQYDIRGRNVLVGGIVCRVAVNKVHGVRQTCACRFTDAKSDRLAIQFHQPRGNIRSAWMRTKDADHVATVAGTHADDAHRAMRGDIETFGEMFLNCQETLLDRKSVV